MVGPDGRPLLGGMWDDEENLDIYREELKQIAGSGSIPKQFEKTVYVGDIAVKVLPGENVTPRPRGATFEDAQYAIVIQNMDPDEVRARYPKAARSLKDLGPGRSSWRRVDQPRGIAATDERPKSDPARLHACT
jgi:hypothetical protein